MCNINKRRIVITHVNSIANKELSTFKMIENEIIWMTYPNFITLKQRNNITADTINIINPTL